MTDREANGGRWQLLPELTGQEYAALKADVAARGVLIPVEVDQHGAVLDGHHRLRAVADLRADGHRVSDPPRLVRVVTGDADRVAHVLAVNLVRRHLSAAQRAGVVTRLADLPDASIDMVFSDPPYTDDWQPHWVDVAALVARVLRPGAPAVLYTGSHNLPAVLDALRTHLSYVWLVTIVQDGPNPLFHPARIRDGHRLAVLATVGRYIPPRRWLRDTIRATDAPDKTAHPWQQALAPAGYLIDVLAPPGGLVLDPCCGSGTFGVAAVRAGRRFLGTDIDPTTVASATERLRAVTVDIPPIPAGGQPG